MYVNFFFFFPYTKHCEYILSELQTVENVEKQLLKEPNSVQKLADDWHARSETVRLQLSNYKKFKLDSCNWIPIWPRYNYVANMHAQNQSRASILL